MYVGENYTYRALYLQNLESRHTQKYRHADKCNGITNNTQH